jgi:cholest-4-en-3-one 26-monooxygenase
MRREAPVYRYERDDIEPFWAVTRYEDVRFVGSNDRLFCNGGGRLRLASRQEDIEMWQRYQLRIARFGWDPEEPPDLVYMDRPRHTAFRNLAARSFTPLAMRALEEHLAQYAERFTGELEAKLVAEGEADLVEDFAVKLPLATICDIMGLPISDWSRVHKMTGFSFSTKETMMREALPGETFDELRIRRAAEFYQYCGAIAEAAKANHTDDLTARVAAGVVNGEPLTAQQLHGYLVLLIGAGNETTRNAIAGGVMALLNNPDQLALLCANPVLIDTAAEEILRWVSPVIQFARTATADVELHGQHIGKGVTRSASSIPLPIAMSGPLPIPIASISPARRTTTRHSATVPTSASAPTSLVGSCGPRFAPSFRSYRDSNWLAIPPAGACSTSASCSIRLCGSAPDPQPALRLAQPSTRG